MNGPTPSNHTLSSFEDQEDLDHSDQASYDEGIDFQDERKGSISSARFNILSTVCRSLLQSSLAVARFSSHLHLLRWWVEDH